MSNVWTGREHPWRVPQPSWMRGLKVGDVIRKGDGPFRVVRELMRRRDGRLYSVSLTIRRCSWTHRCYTILNATDLRQQGYRQVRVRRRPLRKRIDRAILKAIHEPAWQKSLTCCDVESVS